MWVVLALGFAGAAVAKASPETAECLECHTGNMPGLVTQWQSSNHWQAGMGCYECHRAEKGDPDALDHNGWTVATIVSPKDCGRCHASEVAEQQASHHA